MHVAVITGTTREGRFSERVARWVVGHLGQRPGWEVEEIDLIDHQLPYFDGMSPMRTPRQYPDDAVRRVGEAIDRADGFVVLAAEYNHGYPAVLKNMIDWTWIEWRRKPMTFVGWGNVGGARAVEQLRLVAVELEVAPLRHAVHILPEVLIAARSASPDDLSIFEPLTPRLDLLADDLDWWMQALTPARRVPTAP